MYRWEPYRSVWSNLVRRVLVRDGRDDAYFAVVNRRRDGGWEVVLPLDVTGDVYPDRESAERAAEAALGIDPSEVSR